MNSITARGWVGMLTVAVGLAGAPDAGAWFLGDWVPEAQISATFDDNVNRSFDGDGEKKDFILEPSIAIELQRELAPSAFLHTKLSLSGALHGKYDGLNRVVPRADVGVRQVLGDEPGASALRGDIGLAYEFYDYDARFGALINPRVEWSRNFDDMVIVALFYEYDNRFASDNSVYDVSGHTLGVDGEIALVEDVSILLGYSFRRGDVVVHEPRSDLGEEIKGKRLPLDTFRDRYDAVNYSDADIHRLSIGLRRYLGIYTSVQASYTYELIDADGEDYPSNQLAVGLVHLL